MTSSLMKASGTFQARVYGDIPFEMKSQGLPYMISPTCAKSRGAKYLSKYIIK